VPLLIILTFNFVVFNGQSVILNILLFVLKENFMLGFRGSL